MHNFVFGDFFFIFIFLCVFAIPFTVGYIIYQDAKKHAMEAWLWTIIAILVPWFIGVIIYLVVRKNYPSANMPICKNCKTPIQNGWKICPICGTDITKPENIVAKNTDKTSKIPFILLALEVILPIIILVVSIILL